MRYRQINRCETPSLLAELQQRLSPAAFDEVRRALRHLVGQRYRIRVRDVVHPEELALALSLLKGGMPRPEIKEALMVRLGISKAKAYRLIEQALNARAVVPPTHAIPAGLRQLALALDDEED